MAVFIMKDGSKVLYDEGDADIVAAHPWHRMKKENTSYAVYRPREKGTRKMLPIVKLHRLIMRPPIGLVVDHINRNGLDNRRSNLRLVTISQNRWNSTQVRGGAKFWGVYKNPARAKYQAAIVVDGKFMHLGMFDTPEDAARAYDSAALLHRDAHCPLNFPKDLRR